MPKIFSIRLRIKKTLASNPEGGNHEESRLVSVASVDDQQCICSAPPSPPLSRLEG
jgi:hypothetical protein